MNNTNACIAILGFVCVMTFVMFAGCTQSTVAEEPTPNMSVVYSTDIIHVNEDGFSEIFVVYIPKTYCMCHVYDDGYSGGISCISCNEIPGGCP